MTTTAIELFYLNIGDSIKMLIKEFYYRQIEVNGVKYFEMSDKQQGDEWIPCREVEGAYCGDTYNINDSTLKHIKVRLSAPINMGSSYRNYITFSPSQVFSLSKVVGTKSKINILDKLSHTLALEKNACKN